MSIDIILERDLQWREAELASLKVLFVKAEEKSVARSSLLRAMWALLYAHFEGFTKYCWDTILDHIQAEQLPRSDLDEKFAVLAFEKDFGGLRGNLASQAIWDFFHSEMPAALTKNADFPEELRLKTESNLWPNVFERETMKLGITCPELNKHRQRIKTLVARRNDIAHGKSMTIATINEYNEYENAAICLMHELALKTMEVAESELYKKPTLRIGATPTV